MRSVYYVMQTEKPGTYATANKALLWEDCLRLMIPNKLFCFLWSVPYHSDMHMKLPGRPTLLKFQSLSRSQLRWTSASSDPAPQLLVSLVVEQSYPGLVEDNLECSSISYIKWCKRWITESQLESAKSHLDFWLN